MADASSPKLPRNEKWRDWQVTKNRAVRIPDPDWADYKVVCEAEDTDRTSDLRAHIQRRIQAFRDEHPDTPMPSDQPHAG